MSATVVVKCAALLVCLAVPGFGDYSYYFSSNLTSSPFLNLTSSASPVYTSRGMQVGSGGVSLIGSRPTGLNPDSYEVKTAVEPVAGSMSAFSPCHYLRASADASWPRGTGTFYRAVFGIAGGSIYTSVVKRVGGVITIIGSATVGWKSPAPTLRSVIKPDGKITVFVEDRMVLQVTDTSIASGAPGIGIDDSSPAGTMTLAAFGALDTTAPQAIVSSSVRSFATPNAVDLSWPGGADDASGIGIWYYVVKRGSVTVADPAYDPWVTDATVAASSPYAYQIWSVDFHGNTSAQAATVSVTTPPAGAIDARQVGVRPLGTYWGTAGEQIDLRSGNLNYTVPLLTAKGRNGKDVTFALNYNSQMWRQDGSGTWKLGTDIGYGIGWRLMAGAITPVWQDNWTIHHYLYTDSTGAEYRLDVNDNGKWRSREGIYVAFDPTTDRLYFRDGSYWLMGAISGGVEQDAGSRYPTEFHDAYGNATYARYRAGAAAGRENSSGRISEIQDVRAQLDASSGRLVTYRFGYDSTTGRRLTTIGNEIGTAESYTFDIWASTALLSPFAGNANYGNTEVLYQITNGVGQTQTFHYVWIGTAGITGELARVQQPGGGYVRWDIGNFTFSGGRTYREVTGRCLAKADGAAEQSYTLGRDTNDVNLTAHSSLSLADNGSAATKTWAFRTGADWSVGLLDTYKEVALPGGTTVGQKNLTWTQDAGGNPYVARVETRLDPGTANEKMSAVEQSLDARGNVTQARHYDYGAGSTPTRTFDSTYVTSTTYTNLEKWNLLKTSSLTAGGQTVTLVTNTYDGVPEGFSGGANCTGEYSGAPPAGTGLVTKQVSPGNVTNFRYSTSGTAVESNDGNGHEVAVCLDGTLTKPKTITPQKLSTLKTTLDYTTALAPTTVTEPNSAVTQIAYDGTGRPSSTTSKFGAVTTYTYSNNPAWTMAATNGHWVKTWKDGFGRTIKVEKGDGAPNSPVTKSVQETEYGPCACSPLGKVSRVSNPYAPGGTPVWTTYQYDARGRTTRVTLPDGSATVYAYAGNAVTITDPAGKWKKQVTDAFGNVVQVVEPDPAGGGATWATNYTFDAFDRMVQVLMPRGSVTQTRTWVYDAVTQRVASVTEPETGTKTYTWNADGTLQNRSDARASVIEFSYDNLKRVTKKTPKKNGVVEAAHVMEYFYDSYAAGGTYVQNATGRLAAVRTGYELTDGGTRMDYFEELYAYSTAGLVTGKKLRWNHTRSLGGGVKESALAFSYNNEGQVTNDAGAAVTYDSMGRPYSGPGVPSVSYGPADEITLLGSWTTGKRVEQRVYNSLGQLIVQKGVISPFTTEAYEFWYTYADGANNGRITKFRDQKTGEEVNYSYDALNRLVRAETTGPEWGETMSYDGFGNLLSETPTKGTAPGYNLTVDGTTNRILNAGFAYDAAGNMTSNPLQSGIVYFAENRMKQVGAASTVQFRYAPDGQRLMKGPLSYMGRTRAQYVLTQNVDAWIYVRDAAGRLRQIVRYRDKGSAGEDWVVEKQFDWFLGTQVEQGTNKWYARDRVGSVRAVITGYPGTVTEHLSYFPYGQERGTATANDRWKFGTYWRDGVLDDASQRWYASGWGRFTTADPYEASGGAGEPGSWNRYAYVGGDPVNFTDASGMLAEMPYPPGYCPAAYSYQECMSRGFFSGSDGGVGGGGGGPCAIGDSLLPNPLCPVPGIVVGRPDPPEPNPECFAQLKYRPVDDRLARLVSATHAFWWVQGSSGRYILSGGKEELLDGPSYRGHAPRKRFYLKAWATPQNDSTIDTPTNGTVSWATGLASSLCDAVDKMIAAARRFPSHALLYDPSLGPNSNSIARYLAKIAGFDPLKPPNSFGWSTDINVP